MASALYLPVGAPWPASVPTVSFTNFSLNGSTDAIEYIFQMPEAATITHGWFRLNAVTGASPVYRASLQGVNTSGEPDGTIKGGGSPVSKTFTPSGSATFQKIAFDNSYVAARGELLALVMDYSSGTIDGSNFASMTSRLANGTTEFPYPIVNDAGARSKVNTLPVFAVASASKVYGFPVLAQVQTIINASEAGSKFSLPSGWGDTYKVVGVHIWAANLVLAKTLSMKLYSGGDVGDTTVLQDVTWDSDWSSATSSADTWTIYFDESSLSTLTFGNTYRIALSTPDASNQTLQGFSVSAVADLDAFPLGQQFTLSTRAGGNWTDTATTRNFMEIILDDITKPSGGGGGGGIFF